MKLTQRAIGLVSILRVELARCAHRIDPEGPHAKSKGDFTLEPKSRNYRNGFKRSGNAWLRLPLHSYMERERTRQKADGMRRFSIGSKLLRRRELPICRDCCFDLRGTILPGRKIVESYQGTKEIEKLTIAREIWGRG